MPDSNQESPARAEHFIEWYSLAQPPPPDTPHVEGCQGCRIEALEAKLVALREALWRIEPMQRKALLYIEANGFVFESIGQEAGNWQHLAFSLYTDLCEVDSITREALDAASEEKGE